MNDKEIDDLEKAINEYQKKVEKGHDGTVGNPAEYLKIMDKFKSVLSKEDYDGLKDQLKESLTRLSMPRDKLIQLEEAEDKGLYGITSPKIAKVIHGVTNEFMRLMLEEGLTKVPNEAIVKMLFMVTSFVLTDMMKNTQINIRAHMDVMTAICSNVTILFKLMLDECRPEIRDTMKNMIPITLKTLITDDKLEEFSSMKDGAERTENMLREIIDDVMEVEKKQASNKADPRRFWRDDIYKTD